LHAEYELSVTSLFYDYFVEVENYFAVVRGVETLSDTFRIKNFLKEEYAISPSFGNLAIEHAIRKVQRKP
jgi:hypothetical protein